MAYVEVTVDKDILVLDIAVRNALAIEVINGLDHLRENISRLILRKPFMLRLFDTFKQVMRRATYDAWPGRRSNWRLEQR